MKGRLKLAEETWGGLWAQGVDGWSPAELRALSRSHIKGLTYILIEVEKNQKLPHYLIPIIALIPKDGAEHKGQLTPIAIVHYIYRVWMAVVKSKVKQWAMK
eukprot:8389498-Heterocapsa_arctica.AAC.1